MDFELSDDQLALREAASTLLDAQCDATAVRAAADAGGFDAELWSAMVDQGWTGLAVPEEEGGLGLGTVEVAVVLEDAGRHLAPVPLLPSLVALDALRSARSDGVDGLDAWTGALLDGATTGTIGWSARSAAVVATGGDEPLLSGRTAPAVGAPSAGVAVVCATERVADGGRRDLSAVYAVDLDAVGCPDPQPAMDRTRQVGWLEFDATPAIRLGGAEAAEAVLGGAATFTSVEMLGAASAVLDMSVEYAKERVQFGRPIGSFQAVKHRCADMLVDVEGMRSSAYWAAWCLGASDPEAPVAASTAKIWCSDAAKRVMDSGLQVHGGIGFTWEHDLHLFMKRSHLDQVSFGDAAYHRQRLAGLLRAQVEAGNPVL